MAHRLRRVQASLKRVGGQLAFTSPKTKRSRRAIPLPRVVVKVMREHQARQEVERASAELWADDDLVFTTSIGTPIEPRNLSLHFEGLGDGRVHTRRRRERRRPRPLPVRGLLPARTRRQSEARSEGLEPPTF